MRKPRKLSTVAPREFRKVRALFSDLDDTMTTAGRLPSAAVRALESLKKKNFRTAIVTGRPAGWADSLLALLPLDAVVFENGAGVLYRDGDRRRLELLAKVEDRARLETIWRKLSKAFPELRLAADQSFRRFDYAIDICEEAPHVAEATVQRVLASLGTERDVTAKLSSIHINYWCGPHTKIDGCRWLLERWKLEINAAIYCGDSPNDEPLFGWFPNSVAVANVEPYLALMKAHPRHVLSKPGASGFVQLARLLTVD